MPNSQFSIFSQIPHFLHPNPPLIPQIPFISPNTFFRQVSLFTFGLPPFSPNCSSFSSNLPCPQKILQLAFKIFLFSINIPFSPKSLISSPKMPLCLQILPFFWSNTLHFTQILLLSLKYYFFPTKSPLSLKRIFSILIVPPNHLFSLKFHFASHPFPFLCLDFPTNLPFPSKSNFLLQVPCFSTKFLFFPNFYLKLH